MRFLSDILAKAGLIVDGTTTLNGAGAATVDTDKFVVLDGAVVKYRTGAQVLSDIGAVSTNIYTSNGTLTGNRTLTLSTNYLDIVGTTTTRFSSAGNLIIGGTVDSGWKLDVNGNIRATLPGQSGELGGVFYVATGATVRPYAVDMVVGNYLIRANDSDLHLGAYYGTWLSGPQMYIQGVPTLIWGTTTGPANVSRLNMGVSNTNEYLQGGSYPNTTDNYFYISTEIVSSSFDRRRFQISAKDIRFLTGASESLAMTIGNTGTVTVNNLSGTGTRMVVADATGLLSTQAIPTGGGGGSTSRSTQTFTATSNQTAFTVSGTLTAGYFDVYLNGVRLNSSSYSNTSSVLTLVDGAATGDIIDVINYDTLSITTLLPDQTGNAGKYLTTDGTNLSWAAVSGSGTVTSVSVVSANGFAGTVATATTTPAITISTTITGLLKGNGTAISAAVAGTDYQSPISLTTTGSSGAATFSSNSLNIPNYTLAGLGGQPLATNLTSLAGLSYVSASFVKMTAAGTFSLDTNTYYLSSNPNGYTSNTGTVTTVSVVSANGFAGSVATASTTPAITISTSVTGILKGNGTAISAAVAGTDYLVSNQTITLSGDVSGSGSTAITTAIGANKVTNAMLAQVSTATFKGRTTAGTGNVEDLTGTQATALLDLFSSSVKGLVPASGGGTTNFLRADGTWAAPPAGGGAYSVITVTTTHSETATSGTKIIKADTSGGAFTINLPTAVGNTATIIIKKIAGSGALTVDGNGTQTIDGGTTAILNKVYESITLISDNSNWQIV